MFKQVIGTRFLQSKYSKPGQGSREIMLSCGHVVYRKASYPVPRRARCRQCIS